MKISAIVPTLNASDYIFPLLYGLKNQTVCPDEIVIVDSDSDDDTIDLASTVSGTRIISIPRQDFDHGKTRDMAIRSCNSDLVLLLTQDALPKDEHYIENLIRPFEDPEVVAVSGRQLPKADARAKEKLIREFNYPAVSCVRTKADIPRLGIKTFFFSDACSAIRRNEYLKLGGFDYPILTDEDLFFAARAILEGYKIAYAADAEVYHSHNLSYREQYERNRIQGVEFRNHEDLLRGVSLEKEGTKMLRYVTRELARQGKYLDLPDFYLDCLARYLGSRKGRKRR